jgi:hypothetical protein
MLVFVHIPKAAGSTFGKILRHHYPGRAFDKGINVFERFDLAGPRLEAAAALTGRSAVSAEVTFGLADQYLAGARYLTILRSSVERALSQFWYFKAARGTGQVPPWLPPPSTDLTLEQAVAEGSYILDNLQTRMLCGLVSPYDPLPPDALEQAKRNLAERFAFVGTTERFDELVAVVNLELGWPTLPYRRTRVNQRNKKHRNPSAEALRLVEERHTLDAELHRYAGELLDQAVRRGGPALELELEVLRESLRRQAPTTAEAIRRLPVEARVELALKEAQLERAATKEAKNMRARRHELRELEQRLAASSLKGRLRGLLRR